ncbi:hypothetical protein ABT025_35575 [Streptomyces sp. NPDC002809]
MPVELTTSERHRLKKMAHGHKTETRCAGHAAVTATGPGSPH